MFKKLKYVINEYYVAFRIILCSKNIHFYVSLFNGFPAFSNYFYHVKFCRCCNKTDVLIDSKKIRPSHLMIKSNCVSINSKLTDEEKKRAKLLVYEVNKVLVSNKLNPSKVSDHP